MKRLPSQLIDETMALFLDSDIPVKQMAEATGIKLTWLYNFERYYKAGFDFSCSKIETLNKYLKEK